MPRGALFEGELRVEGLKEGQVRSSKGVCRGPRVWAKGTRGDIRHVVATTLDGHRDEGGGLVDVDPHHEGPNQAMADTGPAGRHAPSPADCRGVVAPGGDVLVFEPHQVFKDKVLEEEAGHFEVIDGEVAGGVGGRDEASGEVGRPGQAPDDRM